MRIKPIDGFRSIAVLGVLWAHLWMFLGTPSFQIGPVDVAKLIGFFGTGVDLFFVISGFCMYWMYASKQSKGTIAEYAIYLKKRWYRIAPAFYAAIIVYALVACNFNILKFGIGETLKLIFFVKIFFPGTEYGPHFWSLCTEWHFYLLLPLIIIGIQKLGFKKSILSIIGICILFRLTAWYKNDDVHNYVNYFILNRLIEFIAGIICARLYIGNKKSWVTESMGGLLLGIFIAFSGRLLMTAGMQDRTDFIGFMSRVFNLPLLSFGYAIVILNVLNRNSIFRSLLESRIMTSIGKYSYSMYLWHWILAESIALYFKLHYGYSSFWHVNILFVLTILFLYPISMLSYQVFESFYFKRGKRKKNTQAILINNTALK